MQKIRMLMQVQEGSRLWTGTSILFCVGPPSMEELMGPIY